MGDQPGTTPDPLKKLTLAEWQRRMRWSSGR